MKLTRHPWVAVLGSLTAMMGVVNILSSLTPSDKYRRELVHSVLPYFVTSSSRLFVAVAGIVLLMLAKGLFRHKRHAWQMVVLLLGLSMVSHLAKGLDWEEATLSAALLVGFVANRRRFRAVSDPRGVQGGLRAFAGAVTLSYGYGVLGFYLLDRHFHQHFSFLDASQEALKVFFTLAEPPVAYSRLAHWFLNSIEVVAAVSISASIWLILRPMVYRNTVGRQETEKAMALLQTYGKSSLARFTVWDDKAYFFSRSGNAFVSYKVVGDVALALGDPIGPDGEVATVVTEFSEFCAENDWVAAYYQVLEGNLQTYRDAGMASLKIGEEAVIDLAKWSLQGGSRKGMRNMVSRLQRLGYSLSVLEPPFTDDLLDELKSVSDEWLTTRHGAEKTFSLGYFNKDYIGENRIAIVRDAEGVLQAFSNTISEYARNEGTIDLMRHRDSAAKGTMEFLLVMLASWFKDHNYDSFNLGLAPMSGTGASGDAPVIEKGVHLIYEHMSRFYSFRGLRMFKEKFDPGWEPRYLVYPGVGALPKVAYAIVSANSGGRLRDYVTKPLKRMVEAAGVRR